MKKWIEAWRRREPAHLATGRWGERQAERLLKKSGYRIKGRRVRVGRHDEIDLLACKGPVLVFVEVKTRSSETYGRPFSAVNKAKRKRLSRAAVGYLRKMKSRPDHIRFDVVEVVGAPGAKPELRHIENAFQLDSSVRLWW